MTYRRLKYGAVAIAAICATLITGCASESPEALVVSAKQHLAKNEKQTAIIQLRNALQQKADLAEARYLLGKTLLDSGDVAGAEKELRRALELQYSAEEVVPPLARALVALGRHKEILSDLGRVEIAAPQGKAELLTSIGESHLALKKIDLAGKAFSLALAAQPNYIPAHLGQARIAASSGNIAEAAAIIDKALAISPTDADAWLAKGDVLSAQKQPEAAMTAYRKAIESKPDAVAAHFAVVSILIQDNKLEDAEKQLNAMKQVAPRHPRTLYMEALLAYRQKNFVAARQASQQLLRVTPDYIPGVILAGSIEFELKSYAQAETHFASVLERAPQLRFARRALISSYLKSGQPGKALEALKPALGSIDKDPDMLALAGEVFLVNREPARAAEFFAKASALDPGDPRKRTSLALTRMAKGETDEAFRELEQTAATDPGVRADLALIAGHLKRGNLDKALAAIAALEKKQPDSPMPHVLRGSALLAKRDAAGARRSYERALELDATYYYAVASLADLDLAEKKPEAARQRFEALLAKDPKNMQVLLGLAAVHAYISASADRQPSGGEPRPVSEDVIALLNKAIAAHPTEPAPRLALIRYYVGMKDAKKAVPAAQAAVATLPDRPDILDAAGRAYQIAGDTFQAVSMYQKLAALQRTSPFPYLRMAEVQAAANKKEDAVNSLNKALDIKRDLVEAQRGLIALNVDAGRYKEALSVAREVQKQRPKESVGYIFEGDIHAAQKKWSDAVNAYRTGLNQTGSTDLALRVHSALVAGGSTDAERFATTWLKDHPKDVAFRTYVAQAASSGKDYRSAALHYRKLLENDPNNVVVLNNLAWVEGQLKDPKALEHAEKANTLAPNQPAIMDTLGVLLVDKGDAARGLELLQKASAMAPKAPAIRLNLAKALIKTGQKDAARKELDELAKLGDKFSGHGEVAQLRQAL